MRFGAQSAAFLRSDKITMRTCVLIEFGMALFIYQLASLRYFTANVYFRSSKTFPNYSATPHYLLVRLPVHRRVTFTAVVPFLINHMEACSCFSAKGQLVHGFVDLAVLLQT